MVTLLLVVCKYCVLLHMDQFDCVGSNVGISLGLAGSLAFEGKLGEMVHELMDLLCKGMEW